MPLESKLELDPRVIRFTHSRIRPFFTGCGRRVEDTLNDIVDKRMNVSDLPLITVIVGQEDGSYFSLNNRRLYVIKELAKRGIISTINVRAKQPKGRETSRYTIERCGLVAIIMKEYQKGDCEDDVIENHEKEDDVEEYVAVKPSIIGSTPDSIQKPTIPKPITKIWKVFMKDIQKGQKSLVVESLDSYLAKGIINLDQFAYIKKELGIE